MWVSVSIDGEKNPSVSVVMVALVTVAVAMVAEFIIAVSIVIESKSPSVWL